MANFRAIGSVAGLCLLPPTLLFAAPLPEGVRAAAAALEQTCDPAGSDRPEAGVLRRHIVARGAALADDIPHFTPSQQSQLVEATESLLSDTAYLQFVTAVFEKTAAGTISPLAAERALCPSARREGFLGVNYQNAALAAALRKVVASKRMDPEPTGFVRRVLSGEAQRDYDFYRRCIDMPLLEPVEPWTRPRLPPLPPAKPSSGDGRTPSGPAVPPRSTVLVDPTRGPGKAIVALAVGLVALAILAMTGRDKA